MESGARKVSQSDEILILLHKVFQVLAIRKPVSGLALGASHLNHVFVRIPGVLFVVIYKLSGLVFA